MEQLIGYMLGGGNPLTVGVGIVIEVIRKNNSDYDPDVGTGANTVPSAHDPIYLGHLLRLFAENVPNFMDLIMGTSAQKTGVNSTFGERLEPLGFDRFKTCELMAELLHCSNMGLLNEVGSEELILARDAERRKLRTEGKLGPQKDEDLSTDELTMRSSQPPPQEEGRKLEVTNADDDGFEEVEPSKEMSEDTSHEFVKAEGDISPAQPPSFLDKDEDDFVDEPLSSPRLAVGADKVNEQQFEDPSAVVAPLSPSKPKSAEPATTTAETKPAEKEPESTKPKESSIEETPADDKGISLPVIGPSSSEEPKTEPERILSPHPEDTPAPLFSAPPPPESGASKPPQITDKSKGTQGDGKDATEQGASTDAEAADAPTGTDSKSETITGGEPVVGDFLKMQFVDHRVVPTILVCAGSSSERKSS